jgi:Neutral/alkaline non-lysosomal ceramidase, N-terminal
MSSSRKRLRSVVLSCVLGLALAAPAVASARPARYEVGAAKADITPTDLNGVYLGGYGIGPVHPAGGVLRHIYARAIAIRDGSGRQVVIAALDLQGHFLAYQNGPYGFADIANDIQAHLGIPASHLILQSTHTHNGPDDLGVWGGVPDSYLARVKAQTEAAITQAVQSERPAVLRWGTADMTGFSGTFGTDTDSTHTGDTTDYPMDTQMRVLQAVGSTGQVIATMLNYSTHATVYGPLNKVSPDWPGAAATFLEHSEPSIPSSTPYGYAGSVAVVTVGAMGHTWPAGTPRGTDPAVDPAPNSSNGPADDYGNAVARVAMGAVAHGTYERRSVVGGTSADITVANTNAALLALGVAPVPGYHINRANTPPYGYGDAYVSHAVALRVGDLAFFSSPGEAYPSIQKSLASEVGARLAFIFGLGEDQLGYVEEVADYNGAFQCSTSDEWFFTISPLFGSDLVGLQRSNAAALGFRVMAPPPPGDYGPGQTPPSTNCTQQQAAGAPSQIPGPPSGVPSPPVG